MTKTAQLRQLDDQELGQNLTDARKELFNLRFQLATGRLDNLSRITAVRKDIARMLTLVHERELGIVRNATSTSTNEREKS